MIKKIISHLIWQFGYWGRISLPQYFFAVLLPKKILSGPFSGMKYINSSTGSVVLPKLIGTYENELHNVWESLRSKTYDNFIDVGAAEGYYAIGISKYIFKNTIPVIAFELTKRGQNQIRKLASINNLTNINIKGVGTPEILEKVINHKRCFILIDVEGEEFTLLDPNIINFSKCDILVEVHTSELINMQQILIKRFENTHSINIIRPQRKELPTGTQFPNLVHKNKKYFLNEFRGQQSWLWMSANNS
ncbi:MAG: hypothetical protein H7101_00905 [Deinococcales bacterium]|nr:hypothetical protein [Chitinophagaceae bacterium]